MTLFFSGLWMTNVMHLLQQIIFNWKRTLKFKGFREVCNLDKRKWFRSIINSYPWPIFSNFVYFLLGSPTLTMVPEIKIHTLNISCCKDICYFQSLNETDREQIIDIRNLLWISSSDIFFFFLSLVCGFCCWSCEVTERQKRIEILF